MIELGSMTSMMACHWLKDIFWREAGQIAKRVFICGGFGGVRVHWQHALIEKVCVLGRVSISVNFAPHILFNCSSFEKRRI